jgi:hypothetical protein
LDMVFLPTAASVDKNISNYQDSFACAFMIFVSFSIITFYQYSQMPYSVSISRKLLVIRKLVYFLGKWGGGGGGGTDGFCVELIYS